MVEARQPGENAERDAERERRVGEGKRGAEALLMNGFLDPVALVDIGPVTPFATKIAVHRALRGGRFGMADDVHSDAPFRGARSEAQCSPGRTQFCRLARPMPV